MSRSPRIRRPAFAAAAALLAALFSAACDDGIGLLTLDERQALYRAEASSKGSALPVSAANPGAILDPSEGIRISFETLRDSEEPAELAVTLRAGSGASSVSLLYRTGSTASGADPGDSSLREIRVASLASFSGILEVPPEFPEGYCELILDARSSRSESLSHTEIGLFLARSPLPSPSILAYPANPAPGSRVLLVADLTGYEGRDPWLRWTVDGAVRAEGPASEGRDKLLWPAPQAGSAAAVGLALYPASPPAGAAYSFPPPRSASAGLLVAPGTPESADEFSRAERFRALFRMEDTPDYVGVPGGAASFLGNSRLDVHPGGFGLVLGGDSGAGILAPALLLPVREGRLQPCTILARLVPSKSPGGLLFRAETEPAGSSLEILLSEGRPAAILRTGERYGELRSEAPLVPSRPVLLGVTLRPEGPALRISFFLDGTPAGDGILNFGAAGWSAEGDTTVAGPGGYPGLYDEVGVWAFDELGGSAAYPAFLYASRKALGASLIFAEGFEGAYDSSVVLEGGASVEIGEGLLLPPGGAARFGENRSGSFEVEVVLSSGTAPELTLSGDGWTSPIPWDPGASGMDPGSGLPLLRARIRPVEGGGTPALSVGEQVRISDAEPWSLSLRGPGAGIAVIRSIRVFRTERPSGD